MLNPNKKVWATVSFPEDHGHLGIGFRDPEGITEVRLSENRSASNPEVASLSIYPEWQKKQRLAKLTFGTRAQTQTVFWFPDSKRLVERRRLLSESGVLYAELELSPTGVLIFDGSGAQRIVLSSAPVSEGDRFNGSIKPPDSDAIFHFALFDGAAPVGPTNEYMIP